METKYRLAQRDDLEKVMSVYRSLIDTPGGTWDEYYPSEAEMMEDFGKNSLYVACDDTQIIGVASLGDVDGLGDLDCWSEEGKLFDLARIGIVKLYQGRGEAKKFLSFLKEECVRRGAVGIRLIASPQNPRALSLYESSGFDYRGQDYIYDRNWRCYEWKI